MCKIRSTSCPEGRTRRPQPRCEDSLSVYRRKQSWLSSLSWRTLRLILGKLVLLPEFGLAFRCWRRKRVIMRLQMQNYKKYCTFARLWAEKITESCKIVCKYGKFFVHLQQILRQKPYKHIRLTPLYNYLCHNHHRPARAQPSTRRLVL